MYDGNASTVAWARQVVFMPAGGKPVESARVLKHATCKSIILLTAELGSLPLTVFHSRSMVSI